MNSADLIKKATEQREDLCALIQNYHPLSSSFTASSPEAASAPTAQLVTNRWIEHFRAEAPTPAPDPVAAFNAALNAKDALKTYMVLSETWMGIPERMDWREITGARTAVSLLEDPPDDFPDFDEDGKPIPGTGGQAA